MPACKVCNKPIIWSRTFGGNLIPLDAKPVLGGIYELRDRLALRVPQSFTGPAYRPHSAECGKRAAFEKRQLKLFNV